MQRSCSQRGIAPERRQCVDRNAVAALLDPHTLRIVSLLRDRQDTLARFPWLVTQAARNQDAALPANRWASTTVWHGHTILARGAERLSLSTHVAARVCVIGRIRTRLLPHRARVQLQRAAKPGNARARNETLPLWAAARAAAASLPAGTGNAACAAVRGIRLQVEALFSAALLSLLAFLPCFLACVSLPVKNAGHQQSSNA
jgi:hypothetical protein